MAAKVTKTAILKMRSLTNHKVYAVFIMKKKSFACLSVTLRIT